VIERCKMRKELIELDIQKLTELKKEFAVEQYSFTCEEYNLYSYYQQVLEHKVERDYFDEAENKIVSFVDILMKNKEGIYGCIYLHCDNVKSSYIAKKCLQYNDILKLERQGKMFRKAFFSNEEVRTVLTIATKGIGDVMLLFEEYEAVLYMSDLCGFMVFDTDKYAKDVIKAGIECGLIIRHQKKKELDTIEEVYSRLEDNYTINLTYNGVDYSIYNDMYGTVFEKDNPLGAGSDFCETIERRYVSITDIDDYMVCGERFADMFDKIEIIGFGGNLCE